MATARAACRKGASPSLLTKDSCKLEESGEVQSRERQEIPLFDILQTNGEHKGTFRKLKNINISIFYCIGMLAKVVWLL